MSAVIQTMLSPVDVDPIVVSSTGLLVEWQKGLGVDLLLQNRLYHVLDILDHCLRVEGFEWG